MFAFTTQAQRVGDTPGLTITLPQEMTSWQTMLAEIFAFLPGISELNLGQIKACRNSVKFSLLITQQMMRQQRYPAICKTVSPQQE
jgi:hypothetical protein